jgi:hypothetical protein
MLMKSYFSLLFVFLFLIACTETTEDKPIKEVKEAVEEEFVVEDKAPEVEIQELQKKKDIEINVDFKENKKVIEKKFGEQWDFCTCVVLNDSIDKAVKAGNMDDKLMERFDVVDQKCKSFLVMDNSRTPEERMLHDKKIQKCLRGAGVN